MSTPYTFKHVMSGRWEVLHEGKAFAVIERNTCFSSKDGIMDSAELWVIIDPVTEIHQQGKLLNILYPIEWGYRAYREAAATAWENYRKYGTPVPTGRN